MKEDDWNKWVEATIRETRQNKHITMDVVSKTQRTDNSYLVAEST